MVENQAINFLLQKKLKIILHVTNFSLSLHHLTTKCRASAHIKIHRGVEQLAARRAHNPEAAGSSPAPATQKGETKMFLLFLCNFVFVII